MKAFAKREQLPLRRDVGFAQRSTSLLGGEWIWVEA